MYVSWVPMWTHRVPSLLMPSPRTRNSGNAVCKKRIIPFDVPHAKVRMFQPDSHCTPPMGLSPFRPTRIDCRTGRPKNSTQADGRVPHGEGGLRWAHSRLVLAQPKTGLGRLLQGTPLTREQLPRRQEWQRLRLTA